MRSGAGILGIEATIAAWSVCEPWLDAFRRQLHRNRDLVSNVIWASDCVYTPPEATYFAWMDLRGTTVHSDPVGFLGESKKVILQDGTVFVKDTLASFGSISLCPRVGSATFSPELSRYCLLPALAISYH